MAFERVRRKLYFDIAFPSGTRSAMYVPCTPFRSSVSFGDRFGGLLASMAACTGSTPNGLKAEAEVTAFFVPQHGIFAGTAITSLGQPVMVDFVGPTFGTALTASTGAGGVPNNANVTRLRYITAAGANDLRKMGMSAIYGTLGVQRHFSVRLRRANAGAGGSASGVTLAGTLHVQRQHSIEV